MYPRLRDLEKRQMVNFKARTEADLQILPLVTVCGKLDTNAPATTLIKALSTDILDGFSIKNVRLREGRKE